MLSIKNKIRKALGMKPVSENRLDKSGEGTVTDYFPDFSVKQVREYRRGGELIYSSDYGKDEICKNFYTAGKLKSVTTISKETGARTSKTTYYHDGRRTVGSFENDKQIGSTDYFPDGHQIVTTFSKRKGERRRAERLLTLTVVKQLIFLKRENRLVQPIIFLTTVRLSASF